MSTPPEPPVCNRKGCLLTALWQVGINLVPRWSPSPPPPHIYTGLLVCGLCQENVTLDGLGEVANKVHHLAAVLTSGHSETVRPEVVFYDISDGTWLNPDTGQREPLPQKRTAA